MDLNCDLGELEQAVFDGTQEALMASITSANVACGAHAGDERIMETTIRQALRHGVCIGAHPGFPDRANFGRLEITMTPAQIAETALIYEILSARKELAACLINSAEFISVTMMGALKGAYNSFIAAMGRCDLAPITTRSGCRKSSTAEPSRRNSGLLTTSNSTFALQ